VMIGPRKAIALSVPLLVGAAITVPLVGTNVGTDAPSAPPALVCGNGSVLNGPTTAPGGAVTIPAGTNGSALGNVAAHTTYYLASGTHTLGTGEFNQVDPKTGDTFVGAPGAVLSGQGDNQSAFDGTAIGVTIEYLTVEGFTAPQSEGVVNHNSAKTWTIAHDTVATNAKGAGVMLGSGDVLSTDCLAKNGQYGFQSYSTTGPVTDITVTGNEISDNDTANYTQTTVGCGCSGGAKFWDTRGATVTGNYVHGNQSDGLWADTNNTGFDFSGNYFATNYGPAIEYEISYNAQIKNNTFVRNAIGAGPKNPGFPEGAVYISESGADSRVAGTFNSTLSISGNVFTDNWSGVVLWENSNRYCGSSANSSTADCTLVTPATYTVSSCGTHVPTSAPTQSPDYYDNCRWKTQNVSVTGNTFNMTTTAVGHGCSSSTGCGENALFSEYGTYKPYTGWVVPTHISDDQHNHFSNNTYTGSWSFMGYDQSDIVSWTNWTKGYTDPNGGGHFTAQDAGSTYNGTASPPVPPPKTTQPKTTKTTQPKTTKTTPPKTTKTTPPKTAKTTQPKTAKTTQPKTTTTTQPTTPPKDTGTDTLRWTKVHNNESTAGASLTITTGTPGDVVIVEVHLEPSSAEHFTGIGDSAGRISWNETPAVQITGAAASNNSEAIYLGRVNSPGATTINASHTGGNSFDGFVIGQEWHSTTYGATARWGFVAGGGKENSGTGKTVEFPSLKSGPAAGGIYFGWSYPKSTGIIPATRQGFTWKVTNTGQPDATNLLVYRGNLAASTTYAPRGQQSTGGAYYDGTAAIVQASGTPTTTPPKTTQPKTTKPKTTTPPKSTTGPSTPPASTTVTVTCSGTYAHTFSLHCIAGTGSQPKSHVDCSGRAAPGATSFNLACKP
jgi:Right handed beta helix region